MYSDRDCCADGNCFNPLIGGADRATKSTSIQRAHCSNSFQSPHRRGGSRDKIFPKISGKKVTLLFQSPHRRGGSRDITTVWAVVCFVIVFQSPHRRGGSRDIGKTMDRHTKTLEFQSPHRRGGSRDHRKDDGPSYEDYEDVSIPS